MEDINLLQNRVRDSHRAWQTRSRLIVGILVVILVLVILATVGVFFLNSQAAEEKQKALVRNQEIQATLNSKETELSSAKVFQAQLKNLKTLLDSHSYMSGLLEEISKFIYNKAQLASLSGDREGKVHMEGRVDSYTDLGKLILGLSTSPKIKSVKLLSSNPSTGTNFGIFFTADLQVDPLLFQKK